MRTILMCMALLWAGVAQAQQLPVAEVLLIGPNGEEETLQVEVASTIDARRQGLMGRQTLPEGTGMLFVWDEPHPVTMWMKNTLIPLDMLFIEWVEKGVAEVAGIEENTTPFSERVISAPYPVEMVLEIAGGESARLGIQPGWKVIWTGPLE